MSHQHAMFSPSLLTTELAHLSSDIFTFGGGQSERHISPNQGHSARRELGSMHGVQKTRRLGRLHR